MSKKPNPLPNPRRVAAGKRNRLKWPGLTAAGREKLRQTALANKPWLRSTGPRTREGKTKSAANGKLRQKGPISVRSLRKELADVTELIEQMSRIQNLVINNDTNG